MKQRFLIIIATGDRGRANALAKAEFDELAGERTFCVGLSPNGQAPATHFWCSAVLFGTGPEKLAGVKGQFASSLVEHYDANNDPGFPQRQLEALGLKRIVKYRSANPLLRK